MTPPDPASRKWSRRAQTTGALVLMTAPALPWAHFPMLGHVFWLPGFVFHGLVVMGVGVVALVCSLIRRPWSGVLVCLGLTALGILLWDGSFIGGRTEYQLERLQLWIAESTRFLDYVGWIPPRIVPTGWKPVAFVGEGLWVAAVGALAVSLGGVGEAMSYGRTRPWPWVLLGRPICGQCRASVALDVAFCPTCGHKFIATGQPCQRCAAWLRDEDKFCSLCGLSRSDHRPGGGAETFKKLGDESSAPQSEPREYVIDLNRGGLPAQLEDGREDSLGNGHDGQA